MASTQGSLAGKSLLLSQILFSSFFPLWMFLLNVSRRETQASRLEFGWRLKKTILKLYALWFGTKSCPSSLNKESARQVTTRVFSLLHTLCTSDFLHLYRPICFRVLCCYFCTYNKAEGVQNASDWQSHLSKGWLRRTHCVSLQLCNGFPVPALLLVCVCHFCKAARNSVDSY